MHIELQFVGLTEKNKHIKYKQATAILRKALRLKLESSVQKKQHEKEESPFLAIREFRDTILKDVDNNLYEIYIELLSVIRKDLKKSGKLFPKFNNKLIINPATGKPLTPNQWKDIENTIDGMTKWAFKNAKTAMSKKALILGKLLRDMANKKTLEDVQATSLKNINIPDSIDSYLENSLAYADASAGNYITSVSGNLRKKIKETIINAQRNKWQSEQLEQKLFDDFGDINRDFRRIAETELSFNASEGNMQTELNNAKKNGKEYSFVKGITNGNACEFCKSRIKNQVFVLLQSAPGDSDTMTLDGVTYDAVWPGKTNIGKKAADWWPCIPAHPHCACAFVGYDPEYKKYNDMLQKELDKQTDKGSKRAKAKEK